MKFQRFTKLFILISAFTFFVKPSQAQNLRTFAPSVNTLSILEEMEATMQKNIALINPSLNLEEPTLEDRIEKYYKEFFDNLISGAHKFIGTPYRRGGRNPKGFDCSGFTSYIFSRYGIKLSSTSRNQVNDGRKIKREEIKKGDLVFFKGRNASSKTIGHVGIVSQADENGNIRFIHSASSGGVKETNISDPYFARRYLATVRVEPKLLKL